MTNPSEEKVRALLLKSPRHNAPRKVLSKYSAALKAALLAFGSRTPDNVSALRLIEYGISEGRKDGPREVLGLKIRGKSILISDIIGAVEDTAVSRRVHPRVPRLTPEEYEAALRTTILILLALERSQRPSASLT
jgi:hypothetical protein